MAPLPAPALPPLLPCPAAAGWELVARTRLPRSNRQGQASGGFSAASYDPGSDVLLLLSDAPRGHVSGWGGLRHLGRVPLRPLFHVELKGSAAAPLPAEIDGEGLVVLGDRLWVASEGRRSAARPAQLLAFERATGLLERADPLPAEWQPAPGRGLAANQGPEALALRRRSGQAGGAVDGRRIPPPAGSRRPGPAAGVEPGAPGPCPGPWPAWPFRPGMAGG